MQPTRFVGTRCAGRCVGRGRGRKEQHIPSKTEAAYPVRADRPQGFGIPDAPISVNVAAVQVSDTFREDGGDRGLEMVLVMWL